MPQTLLDHLLSLYPTAKRETLRHMVQSGRVTVNRKPARSLKHPLAPTDEVAVSNPPTQPAADLPPDSALDVVFEDPHLLVVNKPPGLLTSTVPHEPRPTLAALVRAHVKSRDPRAVVGVIHRLDRDASGLLVFSKSPLAYDSLKDQLQRRTMKRVYAAVVHGTPTHPTGTIDSYLIEHRDGTVHSLKTRPSRDPHAHPTPDDLPKGAQRAVTEYQLLSTHDNRSLLRLTLLTGRKHQIRVHLSEHHLPILGDPLYAKSDSHPAPRLMLAAIQLAFTHPLTGQPLKFEIPLPQDIRDALKQQGG